MKYSVFLKKYEEGCDYPNFETVKSLAERRYIGSGIWPMWQDCCPLHLLLQEKRFAEQKATCAKNWKVCLYWQAIANANSRRIRVDNRWWRRFRKALDLEKWELARRILHVACGSFLYRRQFQIAWTWVSFQNEPISKFSNGFIPDPYNIDDDIMFKPFSQEV